MAHKIRNLSIYSWKMFIRPAVRFPVSTHVQILKVFDSKWPLSLRLYNIFRFSTVIITLLILMHYTLSYSMISLGYYSFSLWIRSCMNLFWTLRNSVWIVATSLCHYLSSFACVLFFFYKCSLCTFPLILFARISDGLVISISFLLLLRACSLNAFQTWRRSSNLTFITVFLEFCSFFYFSNGCINCCHKMSAVIK